MVISPIEENYGAVYQNLVDKSISIYFANMGGSRFLMPLNYPNANINIAYSFATYRKLADSLEDHIKNAIKATQEVEPIPNVECWYRYVDALSFELENDLDNYENDWEDGERRFYHYVFTKAVAAVKKTTEYTNSDFMRLALSTYIQDIDAREYELHLNQNVSRLSTHQDFLKFEFAIKTALFVVSKLKREKLWENLN
jgi:hypothetical protein